MSSFARLIWLNADERPESATEDLLAKISFCNMLVSLAIALKHRMRFEPFTHYEDLRHRVRKRMIQPTLAV
jgi:predicted membrane chloride channel (bestrophin family)